MSKVFLAFYLSISNRLACPKTWTHGRWTKDDIHILAKILTPWDIFQIYEIDWPQVVFLLDIGKNRKPEHEAREKKTSAKLVPGKIKLGKLNLISICSLKLLDYS